MPDVTRITGSGIGRRMSTSGRRGRKPLPHVRGTRPVIGKITFEVACGGLRGIMVLPIAATAPCRPVCSGRGVISYRKHKAVA